MRAAGWVGAVAAAMLAAAALAEESTEGAGRLVGAKDPGALAYGEICASCHGTAARGDGPRAAALGVKVPDLTGLAAANGGTFPLMRVIGVIEGTSRPGFHKDPSPMPRFGELLGGQTAALDTPGGTVLFTRGVILSIAYYLETLQQ